MHFPLFAFVSAVVLSVSAQDNTTSTTDLTSIAPDVVGNLNVTSALLAAADSGIDLTSLNITTDALTALSIMVTNNATSRRGKRNTNPGNAIDVHSHLVFPWYRQLVPTTGGEPTPDWNATAHLAFNAANAIKHTILASSTPQANVFFGNRDLTVALARLLNICTAAIAQLYPGDFHFFAVVPLPYTQDAINEAKYALDTLGAIGITTMTNHEGLYLGNPQITPFFAYLNSRPGNTVVYVHPTSPYIKEGDVWVEANPTVYMSGLVESYFETARCYMDLTYSQTLMNYTNIDWIAAHTGGSFPSILDRMIKSVPQLEAAAKAIYKSRVWWDSAGPTYPEQVRGLLGYGIPNSQLVFGTDFPYAPPPSYAGSILGLLNDPDLTQAQLNAIMANNTQALFGNKLNPWTS